MRSLVELHNLLTRKGPFELINAMLVKMITEYDFQCKLHPLGFYLCDLGHVNSSEKIRLHIWDRALINQSNDLVIHNHNFDFRSLVLIGKILNNNYSVSKDTKAGLGHLYSVSYTEKGSCLTKNGSGYSSLKTQSRIVTAGEFYELKANEFHESVNLIDDISATLLVTNTHKHAKHFVFSEMDHGASIEFERKPLGCEESKAIILQLATRLSLL